MSDSRHARGGQANDVGYRKPPKHTRFAPGTSGNAKGRPKNAKNFATALEAELNARIVATEGGKQRNMRKRDAISKQLVNKAASGDTKAAAMLLQEERTRPVATGAALMLDALERPEDQLVIANIVRRIQQMAETEVANSGEQVVKDDGDPECSDLAPQAGEEQL